MFDEFSKEYADFHKNALAEFEEKLDAIKKDIIYSNMADKNN